MNVKYDLLYCVKRISCLLLIIPFICLFSFSTFKFSITDFSAPMTANVFIFDIRLESGRVYCGKENQASEIYFCLLFPIFFFLSLTPIFVKDFSGTTVEYDLLYIM